MRRERDRERERSISCRLEEGEDEKWEIKGRYLVPQKLCFVSFFLMLKLTKCLASLSHASS